MSYNKALVKNLQQVLWQVGLAPVVSHASGYLALTKLRLVPIHCSFVLCRSATDNSISGLLQSNRFLELIA
jgi:hypothetical protein